MQENPNQQPLVRDSIVAAQRFGGSIVLIPRVTMSSSDKIYSVQDDDSSVSSKLSSATNEDSESETSDYDGKRDYNEVKDLTRKETEAVDMWRDLVTGILVITACLVTCGAYIYLMRDETEAFTLAVSYDDCSRCCYMIPK